MYALHFKSRFKRRRLGSAGSRITFHAGIAMGHEQFDRIWQLDSNAFSVVNQYRYTVERVGEKPPFVFDVFQLHGPDEVDDDTVVLYVAEMRETGGHYLDRTTPVATWEVDIDLTTEPIGIIVEPQTRSLSTR